MGDGGLVTSYDAADVPSVPDLRWIAPPDPMEAAHDPLHLPTDAACNLRLNVGVPQHTKSRMFSSRVKDEFLKRINSPLESVEFVNDGHRSVV